jgi:TolB protein
MALLTALAAVLVLALALAAQAGISDRLVSRSSGGTPANGDSYVDVGGSLSHDGRLVTFSSRAANLPGGDGSTSQIYVRNTARGKTRLVSTKLNGDPADGDVHSSAISAKGRFVVFYGYGNGLPGANGVDQQVWIHDRHTGKTRLVARANNGDPGNGFSGYPSVSASGRYVIFQSSTDNLPAGDGTNTYTYIRDVKRGKTILVSRTNAGNPAYGDLFGQSISSDGRRAIFESQDPDLPAGDGSTEHIYLRNLDAHRTVLIDRRSNGQPANGSSYYPSISGNGSFVGFDSPAANLPGGDGSDRQAYVRNVNTRKTRLVSRNSQGEPQDVDAFYPHPSGNGRYVAFEATGSNLPGGDGSTDQIYVRAVRKGKTFLLSKSGGGDPADAATEYPTISLDARFAAFDTDADNLGGNTSYRNAFRAGPIP